MGSKEIFASIADEAGGTVEKYPVLGQVWPEQWIRSEMAQASTRYPHPAIRLLLKYVDGDAIARGLAGTLDTCSSHPSIGPIKSRLNKLRGSKKACWRENFQLFWATWSELCVAAYLIKLGYEVSLISERGGSGPDLQVCRADAGNLFIEVHSPQQSVAQRELEERFFWVQCRYIPYDLTVAVKSLQVHSPLLEHQVDQITSAVESLFADASRGLKHLPLTHCFSVASMRFRIEIASVAGHGQVWREGASFVPPPTEFFGEIIQRVHDKARQLRFSRGPRVVLIDTASFYPTLLTPIFWPSDALGIKRDFPVDQLPASVSAVILCALTLTRPKPCMSTAWRNPAGNWASDQLLKDVLTHFEQTIQIVE